MSSTINNIAATTHTAQSSTSGGSATAHTTVADNVRVKSVVSSETQSKVNMENTNKMAALMSKLGTTHSQIDEYSRKRTEEISEEVAAQIKRIVSETQAAQQQLLQDANLRSAGVEQEYSLKLHKFVEEIDAAKAQNLSTLEKDLNLRQEQILQSARQRIDDLNNEANRLKMAVVKEAQQLENKQIEQITDKVAVLGSEDASRRLQSTTTTVITTEARSEGETHVAGATVVGGTKTTVEKSKSTSSHSETHQKH